MSELASSDEALRQRIGRAGSSVVSSFSATAEIERRPPPVVPRLTLYLLILLLGVSAAWASFAEVDRVVTAHGSLEPTTPNMSVQPLDTAVVHAIDVEPGEVVKKGAPLVTLDSTFSDADVAQNRTRVASLSLQMARIEAELSGKPMVVPDGAPPNELSIQREILEKGRAEYDAKLRSYDDKVNELRAQLDTNTVDRESLARQLTTLREIESMRETLFRSEHGSRLNLLTARNSRLETERNLDIAAKKAVELRHQIEGAIASRDSYTAEWRKTLTKELIDVKREHDSLHEKLIVAERRRALVVLRAPVDAVILEIAPKAVGSVARAAESLVTMVPLDTPLRASVNVRTQDIGFIRIGDKAVLKLDAFPFQKHGTITGTVTTISDDSFTDRNASGGASAAKTEPYYRVKIDFPRPNLRAVPKDFRLLPGMVVSAEIRIGTRTVMSYLTYPLIRSLDEAMREP
jgi:HlyD family secretion protein